MKLNLRVLVLALVVSALFGAVGCAPRPSQDGLIFGRSYRLAAGERLDHDLAIFGGSANLETDSRVLGSVAVFGGSIVIDGEVTGDVAAFGGVVSLGDHAVVGGDVLSFGGSVTRSDSAVVGGNVGAAREPIRLPSFLSPVISNSVSAVADLIWRIFQSFALAALAVLVSLFGLRPMERAGDVMVGQPALSAGLGFLTLVVAPFALVLVAVTIILSPVSLVAFLILALAALFGWLVLGLVVGERIGHLVGQEWSGPVSAGVGTLVLSLAMNLVGIIPCIGWAVVAGVFSIGLGGVVLTRFGTRPYPLPLAVVLPASPPPASPAGGAGPEGS